MCEAEQGPSSRAHQLKAIFEAMTDGIFVYDKDGRILRMNRAARDLLGLDDLPGYTALSLEERGTLITQRYVQGQSLPLAQWATMRVLSGEVLTDTTAVEFTVRNLRGRELRINLSGAPIRDQEGNIVGAINICRDVTDRWKLEQRTQTALHALLAMAEALVQLPQSSGELNAQAGGRESPAPAAAHLVGQRLVELTRSVLGCRRVSLTALSRRRATCVRWRSLASRRGKSGSGGVRPGGSAWMTTWHRRSLPACKQARWCSPISAGWRQATCSPTVRARCSSLLCRLAPT